MGRGKLEIKRIENTSNRQVTYSKRRNGIIKKAKEISVLCDAKVSVVILASSGKMHKYCSPSTELVNILESYHQLSGKRLWDAKHEQLSNEIDRIKKENDSMQIRLRHMKGEDISSLQYPGLMALEETLENGLNSVRDKQMEYYNLLKRNEKMLEDNNEQLLLHLQQQEMMEIKQQKQFMEKNSREFENAYNQQRGFNQMPFGFRVQPFQPNLQDRM